MSYLEQSSSGLVIAWHPHFLEAAMRDLGLIELTLEPRLVPNPSPDINAMCLSLVRGAEGIEWQWGTWSTLGVVSTRDGLPQATEQLVLNNVGRPVECLSWDDVAAIGGEAVELTPWRSDDSRQECGATTLVTVPTTRPAAQVRFRYDFDRGCIEATMELASPLRNGDVHYALVALRLIQGPHFEVVTQVPIRESRTLLSVGYGFRGVVGVVRLGQGGRVIDACQVSEWSVLGRPSEAEWAAVNNALGLSFDKVQQWPHQSRQGLRAIVRRAEALMPWLPHGELLRLQKTAPEMVTRLAVLAALGDGESELRRFQRAGADEEFTEAVERTTPGLVGLVGALKTGAEIRWAFRNKTRAGLAEIVAVGCGNGETGLHIASELLDARRTLSQVVQALAKSTDLHRRAYQLLEEVEAAPQSGRSPANLESRLKNIQAEVQREQTRELNLDGVPPLTIREHERWHKARLDRDAWRLAVARIVKFCRNGIWQEDDVLKPEIGNRFSDVVAAMRQLPPVRRVAPIVPTAVPAEILAAFVAAAMAGSDAEPHQQYREAAVAWLRKCVAGKEEHWVRFHARLAAADILRQQYPGLALSAGLTPEFAAASPFDRYQSASRLVRLTRKLDRFADEWLLVRPQPLIATAKGLRSLLASPDDLRLGAALRQATIVQHRLARSLHDCDAPKLPPVPVGWSSTAWREWWRILYRLDVYLDRNSLALADLDRMIDWARIVCLPDLKKQLSRMRRAGIPLDESRVEDRLRPFDRPSPAVTAADLHELYTIWREFHDGK